MDRCKFGLEFDVSSNSKHTEKEVAFSFKQLVISPEHQAFFFFKKMNRFNALIKLNQNYFVAFVLFIGLTKNQILNTKFQPKFLLSFQFQNKRHQAVHLSFGIEIRKFG